jgi:acyl dehydratase
MKTIEPIDIEKFTDFVCQPTDWFTVTQRKINDFAECTLDRQFIHVNEEAAKKSSFGSTIAHGFLSLSMLSFFAEDFMPKIIGMKMGVNAGFDKVRFVTPVKVNSRIRAQAKIIKITEKNPKMFLNQMEITIEIEHEEKPALVAIWNVMQMTN